MKQQKILILLLAGIILAGGAIAFLLKDNTPPKDRAKEVAEKALLASVDCPETVKIWQSVRRILYSAGIISPKKRRWLSPWR